MAREVYSPANPVVKINGTALRGDVNGDKKVDENDVKRLVDYILGKNTSASVLAGGYLNRADNISIAEVSAIIAIIKEKK